MINICHDMSPSGANGDKNVIGVYECVVVCPIYLMGLPASYCRQMYFLSFVYILKDGVVMEV